MSEVRIFQTDLRPLTSDLLHTPGNTITSLFSRFSWRFLDNEALTSPDHSPIVRPESSPSHLLDHDIILCVRTDPEPYGCVVLNIAQSAPMNPNPDKINRLA